jgi:hypothetical protein
MGRVFTAILICTDDECDETDEFVGPLDALDSVLCGGCGCLMQVIAIEGADEAPVVIALGARWTRPEDAPTSLAA